MTDLTNKKPLFSTYWEEIGTVFPTVEVAIATLERERIEYYPSVMMGKVVSISPGELKLEHNKQYDLALLVYEEEVIDCYPMANLPNWVKEAF